MATPSLALPSNNKVLFRGKEMSPNLYKQISSMDMDMSITRITELTIVMEDQKFNVLKSGLFDVNTPVSYMGMDLIVAVLETTDGGGQGGVNIRCRPRAVQKLKSLKGTKVLHNVTASEFVASECKEAGANSFIQAMPSSMRRTISRDPVQVGMFYEPADYPSAWTTIQTLAEQVRYATYEYEGKIYFGKPSYIVENNPKVIVDWYAQKDGKQPMAIPKFRRSVDSYDIEVTVDLPLSRADECKLGYGIVFKGFPYFAGTYMITALSYPLLGGGVISVTASTVRNPVPQLAQDSAPSGLFDALFRGTASIASPNGTVFPKGNYPHG